MEECIPDLPQARELDEGSEAPPSPVDVGALFDPSNWLSWLSPSGGSFWRAPVSAASLPLRRPQAQPLPNSTSRDSSSDDGLPLALRLEGSVSDPSAQRVLGLYRLSIRSLPSGERLLAWQHAELGQYFLAYSDGAWFVQTEAAMLAGSGVGVFCLDDSECASPDESSVVWEVATESGWAAQASLRCVAADARELSPPRALALTASQGAAATSSAPSSSSSNDLRSGERVASCTGLYKLAKGVQLNGRPVWRHAVNEDRILAYTGSAWVVQPASKRGEAFGWLALRSACPLPDLGTRPWEVSRGAGRGWEPRAELCVREARPSEVTPAAALRLGGEVSISSAERCLGLYTLAADRRIINRRPVWQHSERPQLWLAYSGTAWFVQKEASLGSDAGMLCLDDASCASPELSRESWAAASGGWQAQPKISCCEAEPPEDNEEVVSHGEAASPPAVCAPAGATSEGVAGERGVADDQGELLCA